MDARSQGSGTGRLWKTPAWFCGAVLACALIIVAGVARPLRVGTAAAQQAGAGARQNQLTVERIYSAPSLSGRPLRDTMWSPDGKLLTYLDENADGPEIWAVDAANGQRHVLVDARHLRDVLLPAASRGQQTGLGRVTPPRYLWAPGGQALLFISAKDCLLYTSPSPRDLSTSRMPSSA